MAGFANPSCLSPPLACELCRNTGQLPPSMGSQHAALIWHIPVTQKIFVKQMKLLHHLLKYLLVKALLMRFFVRPLGL